MEVQIYVNCGYGNGYSVKEIVRNINSILRKEIKVEIGKRREGDSKMIVSDVTKFKNFFKWEPKSNDIKKFFKAQLIGKKKLIKKFQWYSYKLKI